jgi:exopolyphosphatase/guanosine-5'-triphosphate,3'-diphosphate pyrophosphatase
VSFAAIDVGTNSVKMLIGSVAEDRVVPELHRAQITRLGQGLHASGAISAEAADRTLETLDNGTG